MYRCADCNKVSNPGERLNKVVTETRRARYTDPKTGKIVGEGNEIVQEIGLCLSCYQEVNNTNESLKEIKNESQVQNRNPRRT